ncbi:SMI1/KNR4 family protein [Bacillus alkalicellulosilyticus]|uniref:SMI1/KNR4 family protein n=1 Tax=Alkalihalobacterium alkalicellulosilyticum TaxID=1912214 RepID=UPI0009966417|nr:SMI1/KNR4 family protein [Bacillus alkalicellulosilyticus]
MNQITWRYSKGQVSETTISELERFYNVAFPLFYKEIIRKYNGARPTLHPIKLENGKEVKLRSFLAIGKEHVDNIFSVNKHLEDKLPSGVIAFANDDFGNYFCFDFKKRKSNEVVFWDHEDGKLVRLTEGFHTLFS